MRGIVTQTLGDRPDVVRFHPCDDLLSPADCLSSLIVSDFPWRLKEFRLKESEIHTIVLHGPI
jgi:hypothetical protein